MANIQQVRFRRKIDRAAMQEKLQEINVARFDGVFEITHFPEGFEVKLLDVVQFSVWFASPRTLSWKYHYKPVAWWAQSTILARLIRALDPSARIKDEGDTEMAEPNFDQEYPTVERWIRSIEIALGVGKEENDRLIALIRPATPTCFWEERG